MDWSVNQTVLDIVKATILVTTPTVCVITDVMKDGQENTAPKVKILYR